jgi:hypothetical protein
MFQRNNVYNVASPLNCIGGKIEESKALSSFERKITTPIAFKTDAVL